MYSVTGTGANMGIDKQAAATRSKAAFDTPDAGAKTHDIPMSNDEVG